MWPLIYNSTVCGQLADSPSTAGSTHLYLMTAEQSIHGPYAACWLPSPHTWCSIVNSRLTRGCIPSNNQAKHDYCLLLVKRLIF